VSKGIQNIRLIIPTAENPSLHFSSILLAARYALQFSAWDTENKLNVTLVQEAEVDPGHQEPSAITRVTVNVQITEGCGYKSIVFVSV
jgi:hypothetical protein